MLIRSVYNWQAQEPNRECKAFFMMMLDENLGNGDGDDAGDADDDEEVTECGRTRMKSI